MIGSSAQPQLNVRIDYRCSSCGYGIVTTRPLPACPMCGRSDWIGKPPNTVSRSMRK